MAFFASHAAFWRVRCIFHAKGLQFEEKMDPFQSQILISGNWSFFPFEMSIYLKSYAFRMHFLLVFVVFLNMWSYWLYSSYLVWWPPPQELESAGGGGWPYICIYYIYIYLYTYLHVCYAFLSSIFCWINSRLHSCHNKNRSSINVMCWRWMQRSAWLTLVSWPNLESRISASNTSRYTCRFQRAMDEFPKKESLQVHHLWSFLGDWNFTQLKVLCNGFITLTNINMAIDSSHGQETSQHQASNTQILASKKQKAAMKYITILCKCTQELILYGFNMFQLDTGWYWEQKQ